MILEHAHLRVDPSLHAAFEAAAPRVRSILLAAPGCREVRIRKSVDHDDLYLLEVGWDSIASHLEDFPSTKEAADLAALIGHFFAEPPLVVHFDGTELA